MKRCYTKAMENSGLSYNRQAFMYQITKEVDAMKRKLMRCTVL